MRTVPFKSSSSSNKEVFSSIDNNRTTGTGTTRPFKSIQPDKISSFTAANNSSNSSFKENYRNNQVFITSPYDDHQASLDSTTPLLHNNNNKNNNNYKHISTAFTANHEKIVSSHRPTMGGKTIAAIHHLPANTVIPSPNLMSFQELKALSRRINPREPLSSPHASPTKPPLPSNICLQSRKRARQQQQQQQQQKYIKTHHHHNSAVLLATTTTTIKQEQKQEAITTTALFSCEPCNKKYKTRNGLNYHLERCKFLLLAKPATTSSFVTNAIINCICSHPTDDTNAMIECIECHNWLHLKCATAVAAADGDTTTSTNESTYCCPRCSCITMKRQQEEEQEQGQEEEEEEEEEEHLLQNGITVNLSELCQAKERGKNLLESFKQVEHEQESPKPIRNEFNFISLFSDETVFDDTTAVTTATVEEEVVATTWRGDTTTNWTTTVPSLLFDDHEQDAPSSFLDTESTMLLSPQTDWLHFANFEVDFTASQQVVDDIDDF